MAEHSLQQQIDEINRKLDIVLEELEHQRRRRHEMEDLKNDLTIVGKDLYQSAVWELEEVHDHLQTGDILHLGKKLLRNIKNITVMFEQLESARDFAEDFAPIFRELIFDCMRILDEFDQKGYFRFFSELGGIADRIVTSFTVEDVRNLGDNIVTILNTVKTLTQPDMLQTMNNVVSVYKNLDTDIPDKVSIWKITNELNKPETKKGLLLLLQFLQNMAHHEPTRDVQSLPENEQQ